MPIDKGDIDAIEWGSGVYASVIDHFKIKIMSFNVGLVSTLVGLIITVGTYTGLINMGDSFLIVYGPILGGLSLLVSGIAKRRSA